LAPSLTLEHFPIWVNRLGFPNQPISDSKCVLAKEASMHGQLFCPSIWVVDAIERDHSRRQAAERFRGSASSAIRWRDRLMKQGDVAPSPADWPAPQDICK
jgi:hypothetical protein